MYRNRSANSQYVSLCFHSRFIKMTKVKLAGSFFQLSKKTVIIIIDYQLLCTRGAQSKPGFPGRNSRARNTERVLAWCVIHVCCQR